MIGCGYWGTNYVRVFNELPSVRLVGACDQRVERLAELQHRYPDVAVSTDVSDIMSNPAIDAVLVSTQASSHYELGLRCLEAGKHVLMEKPLTTRAVDAEHLIEVSKNYGLTLMVGHTFLYNPAVKKLKEYVSARASGPVFYLYARRTNLGPIRDDVNAVWDLAPHDVSIFNFLLDGEPEWVSAAGACPLRTSREDVGFITLGYPDEVLGHIHVSWADPNKTREVVAVCEEKRIVFNDLDALESVRVFEKGVTRRLPLNGAIPTEPSFAAREGRIVSPPIESAEPLRRQCEEFIRCVETRTPPLTDGQGGLSVVRVMEALDRSIAESGSPIRVQAPQEPSRAEREPASSVR